MNANIVERLERQESWRDAALRDYQGNRRYVVTNPRFGEAAMGVRVNYIFPGFKNIQVLWESGSGTLRKRVLWKLIEAELEAATAEMRDQTRFTTSNYAFRPVRAETVNGRPAHVFEVVPRVKKKFLMRGRLWVDAADAAIVRFEGAPAGAGFWVRNVHMVLEYRKVGSFWMIASNHSRADVRLFGPASLTVEYSGYELNRSLLAQDRAQPKP